MFSIYLYFLLQPPFDIVDCIRLLEGLKQLSSIDLRVFAFAQLMCWPLLRGASLASLASISDACLVIIMSSVNNRARDNHLEMYR